MMLKSQGKLIGIDMPRITRLLNQSREDLIPKTGLGRGESAVFLWTVLVYDRAYSRFAIT
jgi:hypothetical protein